MWWWRKQGYNLSLQLQSISDILYVVKSLVVLKILTLSRSTLTVLKVLCIGSQKAVLIERSHLLYRSSTILNQRFLPMVLVENFFPNAGNSHLLYSTISEFDYTKLNQRFLPMVFFPNAGNSRISASAAAPLHVFRLVSCTIHPTWATWDGWHGQAGEVGGERVRPGRGRVWQHHCPGAKDNRQLEIIISY